MKKTLIALVAVALFAPSFSYAQVVSQPATLSDLDALKMQLIQVLLQEVQMLQAQLTALQTQADNTANDVATIKQNTAVAAPTGGAVDNTTNPTPFVVYEISYEQAGFNDVYYNGNKKLDVGSIQLIQDVQDSIGNPTQGQTMNISFTASPQSRTINDSCWYRDETGTQLPNGKVCGGEFYRLIPTSPIPNGGYYVKLVSVDGDTYITKTAISVTN
jgi:hypothetical protein